MGWALKSRKPVKHFTKPMVNWVKAYFLSGERTGLKVTGGDLNKLQHVAVDATDGKKLFAIDDYKTIDDFKQLQLRLTVLWKKDKSAFEVSMRQ